MPDKYPTFLIIGANRAGSTSLYRYLAAHPEVFFPRRKELRFFTEYYVRGMRWYREQFVEASTEKHLGEASPLYLSTPGVPARVAAVMPEIALIATLRHPVDRLYSTFWSHVSYGTQVDDFDSIIHEEMKAGVGFYLDQSKYADHLDEWDIHYDRSKFSVLFLDDLKERPQEVYASLCQFLAISEFAPPLLGKTVNEFRRVRSPRIRRMAKSLPKVGQNLVGRVNTVKEGYPKMSTSTRQALLEFFVPYNRRLRQRLQRPLPPSWEV